MSLAEKLDFFWHPPSVREKSADFSLASAPSLAPVPALSDLAWLEVRGAETPKEELLGLLTFGAEVEHALLVQYLYAASSLDASGSTSTKDLHDLITGIALQEMAHFVSVQNLLIAVGGPDYLHIGRDTIRSKSKENPLPFALEPVTDLTVSEYILAEAPAIIPDQEVRTRIEAIKQRVKDEASIEPHRVGDFYVQVYWLLQPTDAPHGKLHLTPDPKKGRKPGWHFNVDDFAEPRLIAAYQASFAEWRGNTGPNMLILPVGDENTPKTDLTDIALENVFQIMEQGEGVAPGKNSHFDRFLAALDKLKEGGIDLLPLARTPFAQLKAPSEAPVTTPLRAPYTRLWAALLDLRYTMLLLDIGLALSTPVADPDRKILVAFAFVNMRAVVLNLITQLSSKTLGAIEKCGPTFALLYEDLPSAASDRWKRYETLLHRESEVIVDLERRPELAGDDDGRSVLEDIKTNSAARKVFVAEKAPANPPVNLT